jgi:hypothetical protein
MSFPDTLSFVLFLHYLLFAFWSSYMFFPSTCFQLSTIGAGEGGIITVSLFCFTLPHFFFPFMSVLIHPFLLCFFFHFYEYLLDICLLYFICIRIHRLLHIFSFFFYIPPHICLGYNCHVLVPPSHFPFPIRELLSTPHFVFSLKGNGDICQLTWQKTVMSCEGSAGMAGPNHFYFTSWKNLYFIIF